MRYLLDTNISERLRPRPDPAVTEWIDGLEPGSCIVSTITVGEIQKGLLGLSPGARRVLLTRWLDEVTAGFADRVLPVDVPIARAWGRVAYQSR